MMISASRRKYTITTVPTREEEVEEKEEALDDSEVDQREEEIVVEPEDAEEDIVVEPEGVGQEGGNSGKTLKNNDEDEQPCPQNAKNRSRSSGRRSSASQTLRGIEKNRCRMITSSHHQTLPTLRGLSLQKNRCKRIANSSRHHQILPTSRGLSSKKNQADTRTSRLLRNAVDCDEPEESLSDSSFSLNASSHHSIHSRGTQQLQTSATANVQGHNYQEEDVMMVLPYPMATATSATEEENDPHVTQFGFVEDGERQPNTRRSMNNENDIHNEGIANAATITMGEESRNNHPQSAQFASVQDSILDGDNEGLVEALPVNEDDDCNNPYCPNSDTVMLARPVPRDSIIHNDKQADIQAKERKYKRLACFCVVLASFALVLTLSWSLQQEEANGGVDDKVDVNNIDVEVFDNDMLSPPRHISTPSNVGGSGTTLSQPPKLPPMKNLELLYQELPQQTKENLHNSDSPQYKAWEWLLNHPNITTYPEWRKKQVFSLAALYHSFEGPNWPGSHVHHNIWLDVNVSECDWILSPEEIYYFHMQSTQLIGQDAYSLQDWQPCNHEGRIQMIALIQIFLPDTMEPSIPPEINFLTSLKLLGISFSHVNVKLEDLLKHLHMPSLKGLTLSSNGARGTIPTNLAHLSSLRHLLLNGNRLSGVIPSEIALMTSLEHLNLGDEANLSGELPLELGTMTRLSGLEIYRSSISGTLPTILGFLTNMRELSFDGNPLLLGKMPSELGLMTGLQDLWMGNSALSGSIPSQIGMMSNLRKLNMGNDLDIPGAQNNFSGDLPPEFWELSSLESLVLSNLPNLSGRVQVDHMLNLSTLSLSGSPHISGILPEDICLIEELDFDCSSLLCGCYCPCFTNHVNQTRVAGNQLLP